MFSGHDSDISKLIAEKLLPRFSLTDTFKSFLGHPIRNSDTELRFFSTEEGHFYALYNEDFWGDFGALQDLIQENGYQFVRFIPVLNEHRIIKSDAGLVSASEYDDPLDDLDLIEDLTDEDLEEDQRFRKMCAEFLCETEESDLPEGAAPQYLILAEVKPHLEIVRS